MNPLRNKLSALNLLPNEERERSQQNGETRKRNEAEIPTSGNFFEGQSGVNIHRQFKSLEANSMAETLHQNLVPSSQANKEDCCGNDVFLLCIIIIGIFSTALSGFVLYLVLGIPECQCSPSSANHITVPGHAISPDQFPRVLNNLKTQLENAIWDLQQKMNNFSRSLNDENQCDGDGKNCGGKSVDGFHRAYQQTVESLERQYNQTEENIKRRLEQTNTKVQAIADQKPNCLLNQAKESKNSTLVTVHVPKSSEDRVTVGVTCSTTLQNAADVRYMMPGSEGQDEFICYCENKISKQVDCVAYFWQCKLS